LKKKQQGGPCLPTAKQQPPTPPPLAEDREQIPELKVVPETIELQPEIVRDPDIVVQTRNDANEKRRLAAQLPNKVKAAIFGYLDRHSDPSNKISNSEIAKFLQENNPETAPLVAHLKRKSLADKIGALRK